MAVDGELSRCDMKRVTSHLAACWACRARKQEMEGAIGEFVRFQRESFNDLIPSSAGPRALLKAELERLAEAEPVSGLRWWRTMMRGMHWVVAAAVLLLAVSSAIILQTLSSRYGTRMVVVTVPDPSITPGATVLVSEREVCRDKSDNNRAVPAALQRKVFAEYGIGSAEPGAYEVDYLITPALGGADDIHNLWPESNRATVWNAQVKDVLEDHLREMVCGGQLDLVTAQREIAENWIEAYKKYFHTDQPLVSSH